MADNRNLAAAPQNAVATMELARKPILCRLGLHKWLYGRDLSFWPDATSNRRRGCVRCRRREVLAPIDRWEEDSDLTWFRYEDWPDRRFSEMWAQCLKAAAK